MVAAGAVTLAAAALVGCSSDEDVWVSAPPDEIAGTWLVIDTQPPTPEEGHGPVDVQQFPVFITVAEGDIEVEAECWFEDPDMAAEYTDTQFRRFLPDNPTSTITVGRAGCPFGHPYLAGLEFGATYSWEITDGELVAVSESRGTISMARP